MKNIKILLILFIFCTAVSYAQCPKSFGDTDALKNISDYRTEIVDSIRPILKQWSIICEIHSDYIETPEVAMTFDNNFFIPKLGKTWLQPFYPNCYKVRKNVDDSTKESVVGVVDVDGNEIIPIKYMNLEMDEEGFVTCYGEGGKLDGPAVVYTFEGRRLFSYKSGSAIKKDRENKVFIVSSPTNEDGLSEYHIFYYDGTDVIPPVTTTALLFDGNSMRVNNINTNKMLEEVAINDFNPEVHSKGVIDREEFMLPIRASILDNVWIRLASDYCDEGKWKDALMCLYQFDEVDYQPYMQSVPECLLFVNMWLTCNKELGYTDVIEDEFDHLYQYNISFEDEKIIPVFEMEDKKHQEKLLEEIREIAYPILIPDYYERLKKEEQARIERQKEMRRLERAEKRQRRAQIWGAILMGLAQSLNNIATNYYQSSRQTASTSVSAARNSSTPISSKPQTTSNASSSKEEKVKITVEEVRTTCESCNGSGKGKRVKGLNQEYIGNCAHCNGRGYYVRYK